MPKEISTSSRKKDHLRICAESRVEAGFSGFSDVRLVHAALPECSLAEIDTEVRFLGHRLASPLFIAAMTGGHRDALPVNRNLAAAAERFGIGMGVGSQRAALEDPDLEDSFTVVREVAPRAFLCANLGVVQLRDHGMEWAERAVEMIGKRAGEKSKRRVLGHTAEERCQAVLTLWTERRKAGEICREMGVAWGILKQWQDRAMEGMLLALQPRVQVERGVALSPRLAVLLKRSQAGMMKRLDKRLRKVQGNRKVPPEEREAAVEKKI